jgi:hypothetical protein
MPPSPSWHPSTHEITDTGPLGERSAERLRPSLTAASLVRPRCTRTVSVQRPEELGRQLNQSCCAARP